ncbi:MAG: hypothetical protein IK134_11095 [Oscillospiraceae bacterium]|nr:hypothetical protein [Oscillospiraceae bacterium]
MRFIDQLKAEVKIHGDMETDFRSRRYHQARNLAAKYVDMIEEEARIAARSGNYERIEGHALISGFCPLNEKDFDMPFVQMERKRRFVTGKKQVSYTLTPENELFEVFLSAFRQLCVEEDIIYFPFQAQILDKDGKTVYHTLPFTLLNPKKEKIQAFGFPYQIEF